LALSRVVKKALKLVEKEDEAVLVEGVGQEAHHFLC